MIDSHGGPEPAPERPTLGRAPAKPWRASVPALIGVALVVALLAIGVVPRLRQDAELVAAATAPESGVVPVSVVLPRRADGPTDLVLPSNIQAIEETAVYARTNGYVHERYVDIGDRVPAGKILAQIDTPELDQELGQARAALAQTRAGLAQAQASLTQARATLQQARATLEQAKANEGFAAATADRFTQLERRELIAHQDADEKRTGFASARAATAAAQANVEAMEANIGALEASVGAARANVAANEANVQRLTTVQSFQKVEAPFAGIITARGIERGALITSGSGSGNSPLFRIARVETLRIFVSVPQAFVRSIALGQAAAIVVPEYPQRRFAGKVASTAGALDPTSRTLLTEVRLRNEDLALMPGMYAQVKFSVAPADAVWLIPATALIARAAGPQVLSVRDDRTVHYQSVQLGRDLGPSVEILAGLTGRERLVVNPPDGLKDGARVAYGGEQP